MFKNSPLYNPYLLLWYHYHQTSILVTIVDRQVSGRRCQIIKISEVMISHCILSNHLYKIHQWYQELTFFHVNNEQITPSSGPLYTHNTINNVAAPNSSTVSGDDQSLLGSSHHTVTTPTTQPFLPNPSFPGSRPDRSMPVFSSTHVNTNVQDILCHQNKSLSLNLLRCNWRY